MTFVRNNNAILLLLGFFLFLVQPIVTEAAAPVHNSKWYLLASNGDKKKYFAVSKYVTLFVNNKAIKGKIVNINEDSITIINRDKENATVAIGDIEAVQNYNRSVRVGWIPILSSLIFLTIGGLLTTGILAGLFFIMPVLSLFTAIPIWLISLIGEPLSKKTAKKGWVFSAVQK